MTEDDARAELAGLRKKKSPKITINEMTLNEYHRRKSLLVFWLKELAFKHPHELLTLKAEDGNLLCYFRDRITNGFLSGVLASSRRRNGSSWDWIDLDFGWQPNTIDFKIWAENRSATLIDLDLISLEQMVEFLISHRDRIVFLSSAFVFATELGVEVDSQTTSVESAYMLAELANPM